MRVCLERVELKATDLEMMYLASVKTVVAVSESLEPVGGCHRYSWMGARMIYLVHSCSGYLFHVGPRQNAASLLPPPVRLFS